MDLSLGSNGENGSEPIGKSASTAGRKKSNTTPRTTIGLLRWGWKELTDSLAILVPFLLIAIAFTAAQAGIATERTGSGVIPRFALWVWPVYFAAFLGGWIGLGGVFLAAADSDAGIERSHTRRLLVAARRVPTLMAIVIIGGFPVLGGVLALVIPGMYFLIKFAFALPACVIDDNGVFPALRRSFVTTGGRASTIVGLLSVFVAITIVVSVTITVLFAQPGERGFVGPLIQNLVTAVLVPLFGLAFGNLYVDQ